VVVTALATLVVAARLLLESSGQAGPGSGPTEACAVPVEVVPIGAPARVACAGDAALAACGTLAPGDRVELSATGCARRPGAMSAPARVAHGLKLDVNRAAADELTLLDGIGPRLAAAIVAERSAHGPFASLQDLHRVRGIGPRVLEKLGTMLEAGPAREGP
jgi:competence ComEA-like helix-hairpin-helix protein